MLGITDHNVAGKCKMLKLLALTSKSMPGTIKLKVSPHVAVSCRLTRTKYSEFIDFAEYIRVPLKIQVSKQNKAQVKNLSAAYD